MQRVDIKRDVLTGKEIAVSSMDLSDTVQGGYRSNKGLVLMHLF